MCLAASMFWPSDSIANKISGCGRWCLEACKLKKSHGHPDRDPQYGCSFLIYQKAHNHSEEKLPVTTFAVVQTGFHSKKCFFPLQRTWTPPTLYTETEFKINQKEQRASKKNLLFWTSSLGKVWATFKLAVVKQCNNPPWMCKVQQKLQMPALISCFIA